MNVKKNILDTLNAGIGTLKLLEEEINKRKKDLQQNFESLSKRGSEDSSGISEKSREVVSKILDNATGVMGNLEKFNKDVKEKFSSLVSQLPGNFTKKEETATETETETKNPSTTTSTKSSSSSNSKKK